MKKLFSLPALMGILLLITGILFFHSQLVETSPDTFSFGQTAAFSSSPSNCSVPDFPPEFFPYRAMLSPTEQKTYDQLYCAVMEIQETVPLDSSLNREQFIRTMHSLHFDQPGLFWVVPRYVYQYSTDTDRVSSVTLSYNKTAQELPQAQKQFEAVLTSLVEEASQLETPIEQERYVHDYLLENCTYSPDYPFDQSAYSALVEGKSVCAGYTRAFQLVMQRLGIPTYYCDGYCKKDFSSWQAVSSWQQREKHSWNIIFLDGEYYNVDVTWNDPENNPQGTLYYDYFNVTDQDISQTHMRKEYSSGLPSCTGEKYSFRKLGVPLENLHPSAHTAEEMGLPTEKALLTLEDYCAFTRQQFLRTGKGSHTAVLLLSSQELYEQLKEMLNSQEVFLQNIFPSESGENFSTPFSISTSAQSTKDGYVILTQIIQLEEYGRSRP